MTDYQALEHDYGVVLNAKRDLVARAAAGLDAVGVSDIYVMREPFRIAAEALEQGPEKEKEQGPGKEQEQGLEKEQKRRLKYQQRCC